MALESSETALAGQVSIVTGAGKGIGAAIAKELARMGSTVVVCGRNRPPLDSTAAEIAKAGGHAEAVPCDVSDRTSVEHLAEFIEKKLGGKLSILVNNAGVGTFGGPLHSMPPEEWERVLNTNLRGVYYCIRSLAPLMIRAKQGHIINISSLAGKNPLPNGAAYAASKWGLNGLSYSVAEELRAYNIRVAVICPGSTDTGFGLHGGKNTNKMLQPEDVAHAVAMLVTQAPQSFISEVLMRPTQKP